MRGVMRISKTGKMREPKFDILSFVAGFSLYFLISLFLLWLGTRPFAKATTAIGIQDWHQHFYYLALVFLPLTIGFAGGIYTARKKIARFDENTRMRNSVARIDKILDWIFCFLVLCFVAAGIYVALS